MPTKVNMMAFLGLTFGLGGCVGAAPPYLTAPANPNARVPAMRHDSVAGQTRTFRPVGPKDWEELNRRVGPRS